MADYMIERGGRWYYFRRVPKEVKPYDSRKHVRISLKTSDKAAATAEARRYNDYIEGFWRALIRSGGKDQDEANARYKEAVALARAHGFAYKGIDELINGDVGPLLERLELLEDVGAEKHEIKAAALLGMVEQPAIMLSDCPEIYWPLCADRLVGKSEHQIRKWKNPRLLAWNDFVDVVGNKDLAVIGKRDIQAYRAWWVGRVADGMAAGTANKRMAAVRDIIDVVAAANDIEVESASIFAGASLREVQASRPSYTADFIRDSILRSGNLSGLNDHARFLIYVMADTGARESEIVGLTPDDIFLDDEIPHIWIRPNDVRGLKTVQSERQIPLVGSALCAFRAMPAGMGGRYSHADSVSNLINKYFRTHGLKPTKAHSLYSFRHTFKDRLRDLDPQPSEELIDNLMGHKSRGPKYGRGHQLEAKQKALARIAFDVAGFI